MVSNRSAARSRATWRFSISSMSSASSGAVPRASDSLESSSSASLRASAAAQRACWSTAASRSTISDPAVVVSRSAAVKRMMRRAAATSRPRRDSRSGRPSGPASSWLTSQARSTSTTRGRPFEGRKAARCRPSRSSTSTWTPGRAPPRAPTSSATRLSRSARPIPATTVRRGCRSSVKVAPSPPSIANRSTRTVPSSAPNAWVLRPMRHEAPDRAMSLAALRGGGGAAIGCGTVPGCTQGHALLAQSAEHSHGKAGVVGSIPTEGSAGSRRTSRLGARRGGVAQLVRALGS
jgi:hypothetical protein